MIRQTLFAVSMEGTRPILTGSLIECAGNEITFVSIDGFRMALRKNFNNEGFSEFRVVVPAKTLSEIGKILQPVDEDIYIYSSQTRYCLKLEIAKLYQDF